MPQKSEDATMNGSAGGRRVLLLGRCVLSGASVSDIIPHIMSWARSQSSSRRRRAACIVGAGSKSVLGSDDRMAIRNLGEQRERRRIRPDSSVKCECAMRTSGTDPVATLFSPLMQLSEGLVANHGAGVSSRSLSRTANNGKMDGARGGRRHFTHIHHVVTKQRALPDATTKK